MQINELDYVQDRLLGFSVKRDQYQLTQSNWVETVPDDDSMDDFWDAWDLDDFWDHDPEPIPAHEYWYDGYTYEEWYGDSAY